MLRVPVKRELLQWACQRAGLLADEVVQRIPKFPEWLDGKTLPTLKQLEEFATLTRTPVGYLFLQTPPVEKLPIADFRTVDGKNVWSPTPDLLETIYICQRRQEWYRDYLRKEGEERLPFVGSVATTERPKNVAVHIADLLGFNVAARSEMRSWEEALRFLITAVEEVGIMVMVSGVVGSNTQRPLDVEEFRGFALADDLAPLIFINGTDSKAGQMFTLAHELAHIWLGITGISNPQLAETIADQGEKWCNQVAAELLVPMASLREKWRGDQDTMEEIKRLSRFYKVSTLVILRRAYEAAFLTQKEFWALFKDEQMKFKRTATKGGGNFYNTQLLRTGRRFAEAVVVNTLEGHTLYRDAFQMLGVKKAETFEQLGTLARALP